MDNQTSLGKKLQIKKQLNKFATALALLFLCVVFMVLTPNFATASNFINVLRQTSINAILAFGISFVIISGGIDLSIGSVVAVSGTFSCGLIENGIPIPFAILVGLVLGTLFGLLNGILIAKGNLLPFIVTLSMMMIARGAAYIYTGGLPVRSNSDIFSFIGNGYVGFVPMPVIIMVGVGLLSFVLLQKSRFGRYVYAVGGNAESAKYSGIPIAKVKIACYVLCALFASISGVVLSARMYSGQPTVGEGFEMDAIAAVVLGGTSFSGGEGTIVGALIGSLIIGVLNNGLNILNIPFYYQLIIKGVVILGAIYVDTAKKAGPKKTILGRSR